MTLLVTKAPVASARMTRRSGAAARPVTRAAASSAPSPAQHRPEARQDALSGLVLSAIASAILIVCPLPSGAVGLESVELLPNGISAPQALKDMAGNQQKKLDAAEDSFKNSDTLKTLLERSEKNKKANAQAIANKYCYRYVQRAAR